MYNFRSRVTDHDDILPAVVTVRTPCSDSQCTSTHLATDVTVGLHPRPRTVVSPTRNVAPSTCNVPTDTSTVASPTSTVSTSTCTVVTPSHTVAQYTRPVDNHAYTVAFATSTPASSAASIASSSPETVAPANVHTVATDTVTVTSPPACNPGLTCARFNHGLASTPHSHAESISYRRHCRSPPIP
jgi:hypothetical protein